MMKTIQRTEGKQISFNEFREATWNQTVKSVWLSPSGEIYSESLIRGFKPSSNPAHDDVYYKLNEREFYIITPPRSVGSGQSVKFKITYLILNEMQVRNLESLNVFGEYND